MDYREGYDGPPINGLEHRAGKGNVLTSGSKNQVGSSDHRVCDDPGSRQLPAERNNQ